MGTKLVARFHKDLIKEIIPEEDFEGWHTDHKNTLMSLKISSTGVSSPPGDPMYTICVESGDGDIFGYPTRCNADLVAVFKDLAAAQDFKKQLDEDTTKKKFDCLDGDHYFGDLGEIPLEEIYVSI